VATFEGPERSGFWYGEKLEQAEWKDLITVLQPDAKP
jgi:hypothetical protein